MVLVKVVLPLVLVLVNMLAGDVKQLALEGVSITLVKV